MYCYMSLCNTPLLTSSLEPLHGSASNFVWMFLERTPTKFFKSECDDHSAAWHFYIELLVIMMCNFDQFLKML